MRQKKNAKRHGRQIATSPGTHNRLSSERMTQAVTALCRPKSLLFGALFLLFFFVTARMPNIACDTSHDLGGYLCNEFYVQHGYQFGVDTVQNTGPYGYLHYMRDYAGTLVGSKVIFAVAFAAMFSVMILSACKYFATRSAVVLWLCLAVGMQLALDSLMKAFSPAMDSITYFFFLLSAHHLLTRDRYRSYFFFDALLFAFLAILSLMKGTSLILVGFLMALIVVQNLLHRKYAAVALDVGCFVAAFLAFWLSAGQRLATLPSFLFGSFVFANGYNEVMGMFVPNEAFLVMLAIVAMLAFAATNAVRLWHFRKYGYRLLLTIFECALLFVAWKHGYVRADHTIHFWAFLLPAAPLLFLAHEGLPANGGAVPQSAKTRPGNPMLSIGQLILWAETIAVAFLAIAAIYLNMVPDWAAEQIAQKKVYPSLPGILAGRERFQMLDRALQRNRAEAAIPNIRQAVGAASVGHHGFFPGFILLNGLNFRSSPTLMTYVAVNEPLMRMNAEFYRNDATAPSFVLSLVGALDGFFPPQEDSLALLQLLRRYRPVLVEKGQLLLKRVPVAGPEPSFKPVQSPQEYTWGDRIALPDHKGRMLWCQVAIDASLTGRIRSFLYKPPRITMMLERDGRSLATFGFLQSAGKVGFLIDPVILDNGDLLVAYPNISATDLPRKPPPDALRFQVAIGDRRYFQHRITVSFSTLEKPQ